MTIEADELLIGTICLLTALQVVLIMKKETRKDGK